MARAWAQPRPGVPFHLRIPVEFASLQASRLIQGMLPPPQVPGPTDSILTKDLTCGSPARTPISSLKQHMACAWKLSQMLPLLPKSCAHHPRTVSPSQCASYNLTNVYDRRPPILDMPATFNLELTPGRTVALETICESDDLDMSRTEDGTLVGK